MLTHWLPITGILFLIGTTYSNIFRCNYIKNKKYFLLFFPDFRNLNLILNICKEKMTLIADAWTWGLRKTWLDKCLKSAVSQDPLTSNMVKEPKHCSKLNHSTFTIAIHSCEDNSGSNSLSEWYWKS